MLHAHGSGGGGGATPPSPPPPPPPPLVGHSERHWLYHSFCWKQLLGQQHAPCGTPPSTHAPSRPMHVVFGGEGGGDDGGVSGASGSGVCTSCACAAHATKRSSNAAVGLRKRAVGTSLALHVIGRRVKRRRHSTKGAWCESSTPPRPRRRSGGAVLAPGASAAILDILPPPHRSADRSSVCRAVHPAADLP